MKNLKEIYLIKYNHGNFLKNYEGFLRVLPNFGITKIFEELQRILKTYKEFRSIFKNL